jgi:hypothetical protein
LARQENTGKSWKEKEIVMSKQLPFATRKDVDRILKCKTMRPEDKKRAAKMQEDKLWKEWQENAEENKRGLEAARKKSEEVQVPVGRHGR